MPFTFQPLAIPDLVLVTPRMLSDARGFFMETFRASDFRAAGIATEFVQDNHSLSAMGVVRGLHFQAPPHAQGKLVRVALGRVWDAAVDLRRGSPTFGRSCGAELSDENHAMLWIPPGFAHGFATLSPTAHLLYKCTAEYDPASDRGVRWNDPALGLRWPVDAPLVSPRDAALPLLKDLGAPWA